MSDLIRRALTPVVQVRNEESVTALLMFAYSFLAMTSYNMVKPITRSKFISDLGAENLPYVLLLAGVLIGVVMTGYSWLVSHLPRRWALPIVLAGLSASMLGFWVLFQTGSEWVSVAFFFYGLILGILLISQFWTLANVVYDPRQAKRLFGFIGGGAPLGGIAGSAILTAYTDSIGTTNLLLVSATCLALAVLVVSAIMGRERPTDPVAAAAAAATEEKGLGFRESLDLLRRSRHLQVIALVISFAAIGAATIEQQLNMAAEADKGQEATDAITQFLGQVQLWMSLIGFVIQIWLTSRIHRFLGIGFALLVLPVSLGTTAAIMLMNAALWAPAVARILDQSLRYTVDKTTREILFLPLPTDLKMQAKPFVDVTVDRFAKGLAAVMLLVLIQPWGLGLGWQQLSWASLTLTAAWIVMAVRARRGYLAAFRQSIERQHMKAAEMRLSGADLSTVETLIEELASPDEDRVLYAIDILEALGKRNLVSPLLLYHDAPRVRARALSAIGEARPDVAERWLPAIERMIGDSSAEVRAAAVQALAEIRHERAADLIRPYLEDPDARIAATAAAIVAGSGNEDDIRAASATLDSLATRTGEGSTNARRAVAAAIGQAANPRLNHLLIPLLYDADPEVAAEAMQSVRQLGTADFLYVPTLISLLKNRRLKSAAREVLVSYGEPVLDALGFFLRDPQEDLWVRRHIPATVARIPSQKSMDLLVGTLDDPDGFLRYKTIAAIERLRRHHAELRLDTAAIERMAVRESMRYFTYLSLHSNLYHRAGIPPESVLARALTDKIGRTVDRIYRLLGLIYPWRDIAAARWALERGDARGRASAAEYLDNLLSGPLRKRVLPALEDLPLDEKVRRGNVLIKNRPRDVEETLLALINDDDPVISACAIDIVGRQRVWGLVDDVEHVLAHRDPRDWVVFEAASWTLAMSRMPEERRRSLWLEPLPAVELAARLRQIPLFASVSVDELFRIAAAGKQIRHEAGRVLYHEGTIPDTVEFLIDGCVAEVTKGSPGRDIAPPASLAFEELLEGRPLRSTIRTTENSVCLLVTGDELATLLAHNAELVAGLFRMLVEQPDVESRLVLKGTSGDFSRFVVDGISPVEKVLIFKRVPVFAALDARELVPLADVAQAVPLTPGTELFGREEPAIYAMLQGSVAVEATGLPSPLVAGPGDTIGLFETLAGVVRGRSARVETPGSAIRVDRDDLFDLLGNRPQLLQQFFSALFRSGESQPVESGSEVGA